MSSGASSVIVPKTAVPFVKTQLYDYPYIDKTQRILVDPRLDIVFISNGEPKIHYAEPLQELPVVQQYQGPDMLSASYALSRRCLSLPIYPELTDLEVEYIMDQLLDCAV